MQWRRDNELRKQTKISLSKELGYLKEQAASVLNTPSPTPNVEAPVEANIDLPTDAKESALASGRFALLSVDLQSNVSQIYAAVDRARDYRGKMLESLSGTMSQVSFPTFLANFREQLEFFGEKIPPLIVELSGQT